MKINKLDIKINPNSKVSQVNYEKRIIELQLPVKECEDYI